MYFIVGNFAQIELFHDQKHDHQFKHDQTHKSKTNIGWINFLDDGKNRQNHDEK